VDGPHYLGEPVTTITTATKADADDLAELRHALWPHGSIEEHKADLEAMLATPDKWYRVMARLASGQAVGFAEASIRHDYVNGCDTSPVGFLEGIYVDPAFRRTGVARQLVEAVEKWARQQGCSELASDTGIANVPSQKLHNALGFTETQRVVYFRKLLG